MVLARFRMPSILVLGLLWSQEPAFPQNQPAQSVCDRTLEYLRNRIEAAGIPPKITIDKESIHSPDMLFRFYAQRTYRPAWSGEEGPLPQADALAEALHGADLEGLRSDDYHLVKIEAILTELRQGKGGEKALDPLKLVDLDLLLTDAFLTYGSHLTSGRVNPGTIYPDWQVKTHETDLAEILRMALQSNQVEEALASLPPRHVGYTRLRQALVRCRDIAAQGGWPMVPDGPKMKKGDRNERVPTLRRRLIVSGDLDPLLPDNGELFDDILDLAVQKFQERHGLDIDGVVGTATLEALNVPAEARVRQIELNMERWRWFGQLERRYILVNIASFDLRVIEDDQFVMTMKVVVGKTYLSTPVFTGKMTYLVLNPYWSIPESIARKEILPIIRKDSSYLTKQDIRILKGWGDETEEINPKTIDWSKMTADSFNYRLRQDPGPINALGRVKFMFPNSFSVYLHDTPARGLFSKTKRDFSHGCIRIEKPIDLAEYLLRDDPRWTRENIVAAIDTLVEQSVPLPKPVPVHVFYYTAWVDENGSMQFRNDVYGRDKQLDEALGEQLHAS